MLEAISQIAGLGLTPITDIEICHVNVHLEEDGENGGDIVGWHKDSYPFVCVVMLSETSSMVGGVLELKGGDGKIIEIPQMGQGSAILLQGRYIGHRVSYCADECVTVVTSFRPSSLWDDTQLTAVRPISDIPGLYCEYPEYREGVVIDCVKEAKESLSEPSEYLNFFNELTKYLQQTIEEFRDVAALPQSPGSSAVQSIWKADGDSMGSLEGFLPVFIGMAKVELGQSRVSFDIERVGHFITVQLRYLEEMKRMLGK